MTSFLVGNFANQISKAKKTPEHHVLVSLKHLCQVLRVIVLVHSELFCTNYLIRS